MLLQFLSNFKFHIILIVGLLTGTAVLINLTDVEYKAQEINLENELNASHNEAVTRAKTAINSYATIVSSIRAFIKNSDHLPSDTEVQDYLNDVLKEIDYSDSIVISLLDTNHNFLFVITPNAIDPKGLKGSNLNQYRSRKELEELSSLMEQNKLNLLNPINLVEGWAALPFVFSVENSGQNIGYIAANVDVRYLLNTIYHDGSKKLRFIHRVQVNNRANLSKEAVFDGSRIYNKKNDPPLFQQYGIADDRFVESELALYGLHFQVGTSYRIPPSPNHALSIITLAWYLSLSAIIILVLVQYTRIRKLKQTLLQSNEEVTSKNIKLKDHIEKNQTLIKEVHHRVKNNMQIISSLLNIQSSELKNTNAVNALESSKMRVQSMALVHEKLYEVENLNKVNTANYIKDLTALVEESFGNERQLIKEFNIPEGHTFDSDTMIPIGLILNELITNSLKHAFPEDDSAPKLVIELKRSANTITLLYSDNGIGLKNELESQFEGIGLELVKILTKQLRGEISYRKDLLNTFSIQIEQ